MCWSQNSVQLRIAALCSAKKQAPGGRGNTFSNTVRRQVCVLSSDHGVEQAKSSTRALMWCTGLGCVASAGRTRRAAPSVGRSPQKKRVHRAGAVPLSQCPGQRGGAPRSTAAHNVNHGLGRVGGTRPLRRRGGRTRSGPRTQSGPERPHVHRQRPAQRKAWHPAPIPLISFPCPCARLFPPFPPRPPTFAARPHMSGTVCGNGTRPLGEEPDWGADREMRRWISRFSGCIPRRMTPEDLNTNPGPLGQHGRSQGKQRSDGIWHLDRAMCTTQKQAVLGG